MLTTFSAEAAELWRLRYFVPTSAESELTFGSSKAAEKLNTFFKKNKINLVVDQKYFPTSLNKIQKLNVKFSASFGRQLEYYTGMVFKIDIKSKSKNINIINGGRYDKLISDLGSKKQVPAVGAALNLNY